jgi:hypothetical protein
MLSHSWSGWSTTNTHESHDRQKYRATDANVRRASVCYPPVDRPLQPCCPHHCPLVFDAGIGTYVPSGLDWTQDVQEEGTETP